MSSYTMMIIRFFIFCYMLFLPFSIISAFADGYVTTNKVHIKHSDEQNDIDIQVNQLSKKNINKNTSDISESDTPNLVARNIQTVGNILSSSPSELADQAKSYALGKFNSTVSSEAQKWLSQFGTARINFGLDKKGTLENNALDLLLPLYDNKADWLLFSQLGYRNKDSRNTINVGLGGRYFYQNWMYGLNTFYDHDLTGKNQRVGLGGELWGDYIKLSANAYYRLSGLQKSRNFKDYHERPANGYDVNGEFFLPVYPNLGAKLTYEQYFGDNVTLFDRDTRQKNPSLAKLGLTYTPIPLVTMGVDYKQGESGHTETQFLANFNYKLGVPLSTQLSPENVAAMRTLTGSRYDLVERNNNIVLDHIKQSTIQLSIPPTLIGYSHKEQTISATNNPNNKIEEQKNEGLARLIKDGGKLDIKGNKISITFPTYQLGTGKSNNYPINFNIFENNNTKIASHHETMTVIVRPFVVKEKEVNPTETLPADGKQAYLFTPVITSDTVANQPLAQVTLNNVQWTTEPEIGETSGLQWGKPEKTSKTNDKGQLQAALTSTKPIKDVKVFLQMDGMTKTEIGTVSFADDPAGFKVQGIITVSPNEILVANGNKAYHYKAVIVDGRGNLLPNQKIGNVKWNKDKNADGLILHPENGDVTNSKGELTATLTSLEKVDDVMVSLSIENSALAVSAQRAVSFSADPAGYQIQNGIVGIDLPGPLSANGQSHYTYTAIVVDRQGNIVEEQPISNVKWTVDKYADEGHTQPFLRAKNGEVKTGRNGELTAVLSSTVEVKEVMVLLSIENRPQPVHSQYPVEFTADTKDYRIKGDISVTPNTPFLTADGEKAYTYTATVVDVVGKTVNNQSITNVLWDTDKHVPGLKLTVPKTTTSKEGQLTAILTSTVEVHDITVSLAIENQDPVPAKQTASFKPELIRVTPDQPGPKLVYDTYSYTAIITGTDGKPEADKRVDWKFEKNIPGLTFVSLDHKTGSDGKAKAIIKSTTEASNVIVTVSSDSSLGDSSKQPVEFKWPTIQKPTFTPDNGTVSPDGQQPYIFTAKVVNGVGLDNEPYTKQDVKFKWQVKLPSGEDQSKTWLSNKAEVTAQPDGTLNVSLYSTQTKPVVAGAQVCLSVIDQSVEISSTENCSDQVDFEKPVEDLKIISVKSTNFKLQSPVMGGSGNKYTYQAKVVKADNTELSDGYKVDATWSTDLVAGVYENKPEWEITYDNTVKNGHITASLSSQVGIGDIKDNQVTDGLKVKLTVPAGKGKTDSKEADPVVFSTPTQQAGLKVYSDDYPEGLIYLKNKKPYNVFYRMKGKLVKSPSTKSILENQGQIVSLGGYDNTSLYGSIGPIDETTGEIEFNLPNKANVAIEVKMPNQARYIYSYDFDIKKLFYAASSQVGSVLPDGSHNCIPANEIPDVPGRRHQIMNVTPADLYMQQGNVVPLLDEIKNVYSWGILDGVGENGGPPTAPYIIVSNDPIDVSRQFVYDLKTHTTVEDHEGYGNIRGYLLCVRDQ